MKIYTITRDRAEYEENRAHTIVATTTKEVRKLAKKAVFAESKKEWSMAKIKCIGEYTGRNKKAFIIMSDFNAG